MNWRMRHPIIDLIGVCDTQLMIYTYRQYFVGVAMTISVLGLSGCTTESPERLCYEATLAYAQATEKFINASHQTTKDVWLEAHLAAKRWKDKVCPKPNV